MGNFHTFVTHKSPHPDEALGMWMLQKWGDREWPGISKAIKDGRVLFAGVGGEGYKGASGDELERQGYLFGGCGGGWADEHGGVNLQPKEGECFSTLVAKRLGIDKDPLLQRLLRYVFNNDEYGGAQFLDPADSMRKMHRAFPNRDMEVVRWAFLAFEAEYQSQIRFFEAKQELKQKAGIQQFQGPGGTIVMAVVESDNTEINAAARSKEHGAGADVVIQKQSSGNVQIHTKAKRRLILDDLARMLRQKEQNLKGISETTDWKELTREGKVAGVPEWYYDTPARRLLNGALSAPETPATKIPLEEIAIFTKIALEIGSFEPIRAPKCLQGVCTSKNGDQCPWYNWGLHRCRKIRHEMSKS